MRTVIFSCRSLLFGGLRKVKMVKRCKSERKAVKNVATIVEDDEAIYVPRTPVPSPINVNDIEEVPIFDKKLITHLERLSLVRFSDEMAVLSLKEAVRYANQLKQVDTTGIKPLETLLEDIPCPLREDVAADPMSKDEVFMNAAKTVEDYFVTPPGNIPLEESDKLDLNKVEDWDRKAMNKRKS